LRKGEIAVLMGPNASGKTTLIKAIAGLITPFKGKIIIDDNTVFETRRSDGRIVVNAPPHLRKIGYVPSDYALFDHLTVWENVMLGLAKKPFSRHEKEKKVRDILEFMGLERYSNMKPPVLSNGLKQKVALARALVAEPKLLLLDEPFSSIDPASKTVIRYELKKLLASWKITTIIASHDVEDAFWFNDRVLVLNGRKLTYDSPFLPEEAISNEYLAKSLGFNVLEGRIIQIMEPGKYLVEIGKSTVLATSGSVGNKLAEGSLVNIVFPPVVSKITPGCSEGVEVNSLRGNLLEVIERYDHVTLLLEIDSSKVRVNLLRGEWEKLRSMVSGNCLTLMLPGNSVSIIDKREPGGWNA